MGGYRVEAGFAVHRIEVQRGERGMPRPKAKTIDQYLEALSDEQREALERLRRIIHAAAPQAEECISYQLPAFRLDGRMLVWFGAAAHHCAFYPGAVVGAHQDELGKFDTSKGTIRFQPETPLPAALVRKLVKSRMAALGAQQATAAGGGGAKRRGKSMQGKRGRGARG
jgi:uncharacterized protein YdhG (YjbR/CyaY superfamily)